MCRYISLLQYGIFSIICLVRDYSSRITPPWQCVPSSIPRIRQQLAKIIDDDNRRLNDTEMFHYSTARFLTKQGVPQLDTFHYKLLNCVSMQPSNWNILFTVDFMTRFQRFWDHPVYEHKASMKINLSFLYTVILISRKWKLRYHSIKFQKRATPMSSNDTRIHNSTFWKSVNYCDKSGRRKRLKSPDPGFPFYIEIRKKMLICSQKISVMMRRKM